MMTPEDLSEDQREVFDAMCAFTKEGCETSVEALMTVGGYAGCLSGDTIVAYNRGARVNVREITLKDLYLKFNGYTGSGRGAAQQWADLTLPTYLHSMFPDGTVGRNRIVAVFESGVKPVIAVKLSTGATLRLTVDHPVATPGGEFVEAGTLVKGSRVLAQGTMKSGDEHDRHFKKDYLREVRVVSVVPAGSEMTYDVQMEPPANNFVANGIIVHNTGKSTVTGVFARQAQKAKLLVAYIAFTGRAASVLARSLKNAGVDFTLKTRKDDEDDYLSAVAASTHFDMDLTSRQSGPAFVGTIHRLVYKPVINEKDELLGWTKRTVLDRDYDLVVVDEASMVGDEILRDLRGFGVPIIAVGDHGQLPPVRASGDLMQNPDYRLERIHRQAEGNPIIALSRHIRDGGRLGAFKSSDTRVAMRSRRDVAQVLKSVSNDPPLSVGLLCWTNKQRVQLNGLARQSRGFKGAPRLGEVLMCLRNKAPVYNGMRGVLENDSQPDGGARPWLLPVTIGFPDEGIDPHPRFLCAAQFNRVEGVFASVDELKARGINVNAMKDAGDFFDFGYALTVHKSQGSQFAHAIVMVDMPESYSDFARWGYTAVTRGQERLTVLR